MPEPAKIYSFKTQSEIPKKPENIFKIKNALSEKFPYAEGFFRASAEEDLCGVDWWVKMPRRNVGVDIKFESNDHWYYPKNPKYPRDNLSLEIWHDIDNKIVGWSRNTKKITEYVLWIFDSPYNRSCLLAFQQVLRVMIDNWEDWYKSYYHDVQVQDDGRRAEAIYVPRKVIGHTIINTFNGIPNGLSRST